MRRVETPPVIAVHRAEPSARILVVSHRVLRNSRSRCLGFELEDTIAQIDDADIVAPSRRMSRYHSAAVRRVQQHSLAAAAALCPSRVRFDRKYDLLFVVCQKPYDLHDLDPLHPWLQAATASVLYIQELWRGQVDRERRSAPIGRELALLRAFDAVFCGCAGTVEPLANAAGVAVRYLAPSVDTLRFCPPAEPVPRTIDMWALGRCAPGLKPTLMQIAAARRWFFLDDTTADRAVTTPAEHRTALASLLQRSRYVVAYPAKVDQPDLTGDQSEIGYRYVEGTAAGAILVGRAPTSGEFGKLFPWPDAVVRLPESPVEIAAVLEQLEADPARRRAATRNNVAGGLMHHDVLYRWEAVLAAVGLDPRPALRARKSRLAERAAEVLGR